MSAFEPQPVTSEQAVNVREVLAGIKRRSKPMVFVSGVLFGLTLLGALLWPPTYSASATILIEEQAIPQDMVRSTITSFANQQIETIRQRVLTMENIMEIVEKYNLYEEDELARMSRAAVVMEFIEATHIKLLNAQFLDPRSGRPMEATIAFTLKFEADNAGKASKIANELVNLFLNENLATRSSKTNSIAEFLRKEAEALSDEVKGLETEISRFKSDHGASLPENFQMNMQNLTRFQTQLISVEARMQEITRREPELVAQLAPISPYAPTILPTGEMVLADVDRLKALQSEYRQKVARYSENHPDVVRLSREIDTLTAEVGYTGDRGELSKWLQARNDELLQMRATYSDDHPEVLALEKLIAQLSQQLETGDFLSADAPPDNPNYVMLDSQLSTLRMEKASLETQAEQLSAQIDSLNQAAMQAPMVEREYQSLLRNREVATAKYLDLRIKLKEAELAGELEEGRMGQRFTLIDPPTSPEEPESPNRIAIVLLGFILAVSAGVGVAVLMEILDPSLRSPRTLATLMGAPPLVTIGYIRTPEEIEAANPNKKLRMIIILGIVGAVVFFTAVHFF